MRTGTSVFLPRAAERGALSAKPCGAGQDRTGRDSREEEASPNPCGIQLCPAPLPAARSERHGLWQSVSEVGSRPGSPLSLSLWDSSWLPLSLILQRDNCPRSCPHNLRLPHCPEDLLLV
ncbi:hypothetical protein COCON_G00219150 [Conger conger]|uniref:Uncharacterized protein n=1 Tax=Conger conger TaxID=82655 RepID=A0A9Q1HPP1_CONCO|nr:hypothetical protein COCON_G00219150 [Conger conger]